MDTLIRRFLEHEARSLLTRLDRVRPFALSETMVPAANLSRPAQRAIDAYLFRGRDDLRRAVARFLQTLDGAGARALPAALAQRRLALLRLHLTAALGQFDLYADALAQRSQRDSGVWLAGLDALATDALAMPAHFESPPIVCYLDRGIGAAIRRARTRLPGGGANPVAVIRVPRERLVGSGIASSIVHEVGHQAAALLGLVVPLREALRARAATDPAFQDWERWISEIVADLWSVARLGVAAVQGLIGVVSLPPAFVFRSGGDDPHPPPWLRVLTACALGRALYPHAQWRQVEALWQALYPLHAQPASVRDTLARRAAACDAFAHWLLGWRQPSLGARPLGELLAAPALQPATLRRLAADPTELFALAPTRACAVIGQARADGALGPEEEGRRMTQLLTHWALRRSLDTTSALH